MSEIQIPSEEADTTSESSDKPVVKAPSPVHIEPIVEEEEDENKEDECDSQHLLDRNTESFRCLAQILVSSSSFFRQLVYLFPPLEDPGINDAFEYVEPPPVYDDIGVEKYTDMCKELEIVPISRVIRSLPEDTLDLKYYGLTPKQMRALTETLKGNAHVKELILQDNWISPDVTDLVSSMILANRSITCLNLKECRIGAEGAERLNDALANSYSINELNLTFNDLGDAGLLNLSDALCDLFSLKILNISHNNLTELSGVILERILSQNKSIEELNLAWNGFYTGPGNKKLSNGIKKNDTLRVLNLAWNGISARPAISPVMRYIRKAESLEYLDLSNNRLAGGSLKATRTGILKNHSLKVVKMGNNCYPPSEAYLLAVMMSKKGDDPLSHLDMENMYFEKKVLPILSKIRNMGKTITFAGILSNYKINGPNIDKVLFERCRFILQKPKKKKAKKDFGHFILTLPEDKNIPREEFDDLLKKKKMKKLDLDLINEIVKRYPAKRQKINVIEMRRVYMEMYPDTCLPPPKQKKKKRGKKGKAAAAAEEEAAAAAAAAAAEEAKAADIAQAEQGGENAASEPTTEPLPGEGNAQDVEGATAAEDGTVIVDGPINFDSFEETSHVSQVGQDDATGTDQTLSESVVTEDLVHDQAVATE